MKTFTLDLILSGLTYVILTYLTFVLMKKRRSDSGGGGDNFDLEPPAIDLPPGVSWPKDLEIKKKDEILV